MVVKIYKQLCLSHQFGGLRTLNIPGRRRILKNRMNQLKFIIVLLVLLFQYTLIFAQIDRELKVFMSEPKNVSTDSVEYSSSFSETGLELYFARSKNRWATGNMKSSIYYSVKKIGSWSTPELASFSGQYDDSDPHLTQDGNTLYFISKRPSKDSQISADIWMVEKDKMGKWSEPVRLDNPINSKNREYSPRTDNNGNLYFASDRPGGYGQGDLYMAKLENEEFSSPSNLGRSINSAKGEWNLEINGSGNLIIFEASEREQNASSYGDLYISFKFDNTWTIPQNIKELNTTGSDLYPHLANNGNILYFTSSDSLKSTITNIYFTEFKHVYTKYKGKATIPAQ